MEYNIGVIKNSITESTRKLQLEAALELAASTDHADLFLYQGDQHFFTESSFAVV